MKKKIESFILSSDGRGITTAALLFMSTVHFFHISNTPAPFLWAVALFTGTAGALARMARCEYCASNDRSGCQLLGPS